ncbi:MAG: arsenite methyltransferase [Bacteroidales bacterium]|jgi:ubiquinone/menaquinone biosynthesis C-methylase UbiE
MNIHKKDIKEIVKDKYSQIAQQSKKENETSCCGSGGCCDVDYTVFSENYENLKGYNPDADLGLGCGIPTQFAHIKEGDTVLDLGSGAGNDCFVARAIVRETGKVLGLDFSDTMLEKARENVKKLGFTNVEFFNGDIEEIPIASDTIDVVVSNCVLNLVPDKKKAFSEIYRVLKQDGHFSISDVVLKGTLPKGLKDDAIMYAGCVAGAIQKEDYIEIIMHSGFQNIEINKEKEIELPDELLLNYLSDAKLKQFKDKSIGIFSITVTARK